MKCDDDIELFYNPNGCNYQAVKYFMHGGRNNTYQYYSCYCKEHVEQFLKEAEMFGFSYQELTKEEYLTAKVIKS